MFERGTNMERTHLQPNETGENKHVFFSSSLLLSDVHWTRWPCHHQREKRASTLPFYSSSSSTDGSFLGRSEQLSTKLSIRMASKDGCINAVRYRHVCTQCWSSRSILGDSQSNSIVSESLRVSMFGHLIGSSEILRMLSCGLSLRRS